ncbi:IS1 family transposase [Granulicella mallensis]|uniref:IS1 family transposase n=1 Tax=Granulicella mallensis TaxID=940614 RepID=A0A7W7ZRP8_9BACT|nr:IS1 family transposase [Granulicella mallensis]MBB5064482.1 IS1 family transposase [Granulicella mallensis]
MNNLSSVDRARIISALVEGNSINAISRMLGFSTNTITKLLVQMGDTCRAYHDEHVTGVAAKRVHCDEIWSFVGAKMANVNEEQIAQDWGDAWTWTALDADSKLVISYLVGQRGAAWAKVFMEDVASRLTSRVQLTTDGHRAYAESVEGAFGMDVDYAMLIKLYGSDTALDRRYSTGQCIGTQTAVLAGSQDPLHISTSYVERLNLTTRMHIRRFTRLTNAFSKKLENHEAAIALHFMHYNFCRVHKTLRVTPAMEAGLVHHVWTIEELVAILPTPIVKRRGPYKKRAE